MSHRFISRSPMDNCNYKRFIFRGNLVFFYGYRTCSFENKYVYLHIYDIKYVCHNLSTSTVKHFTKSITSFPTTSVGKFITRVAFYKSITFKTNYRNLVKTILHNIINRNIWVITLFLFNKTNRGGLCCSLKLSLHNFAMSITLMVF